jgi:hypothetical protein
MENFSSFFNASKERFTPNTKKHHQNTIRSINRKSQNQVAKMYGSAGRKEDPTIDAIVKNNKIGRWPISNLVAKRIISTYAPMKHEEKSYTKAINRTGINLVFNSETNKFYLERLKK